MQGDADEIYNLWPPGSTFSIDFPTAEAHARPHPFFRENVPCQKSPGFSMRVRVSSSPKNAIAFLGEADGKGGNRSLRSLSLDSMIIGSLFTGLPRKCSTVSAAPAMTSTGSRCR